MIKNNLKNKIILLVTLYQTASQKNNLNKKINNMLKINTYLFIKDRFCCCPKRKALLIERLMHTAVSKKMETSKAKKMETSKAKKIVVLLRGN